MSCLEPTLVHTKFLKQGDKDENICVVGTIREEMTKVAGEVVTHVATRVVAGAIDGRATTTKGGTYGY